MTFSLSSYIEKHIAKAILFHESNFDTNNERFTIVKHAHGNVENFGVMCENMNGVANYHVCTIQLIRSYKVEHVEIRIVGNASGLLEPLTIIIDSTNPNYAEIGNVYYDVCERLEFHV